MMRFRRKTFRRRPRVKYEWSRSGLDTDGMDLASLAANSAVAAGLFAPSLHEAIATDRATLVKRIILAQPQVGLDVAAGEGATGGALYWGVCVLPLAMASGVVPDPTIISDTDIQTDWLDLWTTPISFPSTGITGEKAGLAGVPSTSTPAWRDIKVARKVEQDEAVFLLVKWLPVLGLTPSVTTKRTVTVISSYSVLWRRLSG